MSVHTTVLHVDTYSRAHVYTRPYCMFMHTAALHVYTHGRMLGHTCLHTCLCRCPYTGLPHLIGNKGPPLSTLDGRSAVFIALYVEALVALLCLVGILFGDPGTIRGIAIVEPMSREPKILSASPTACLARVYRRCRSPCLTTSTRAFQQCVAHAQWMSVHIYTHTSLHMT